jgi:hypothetical protein
MLAATWVQQGQQRHCNEVDDARAARATTTVSAGNNDSGMLTMMPAQCRQGCQRNTNKDTSAALARPLKAKLLWTDAGYGNEATGDDEEDVSQDQEPPNFTGP